MVDSYRWLLEKIRWDCTSQMPAASTAQTVLAEQFGNYTQMTRHARKRLNVSANEG
jgi:hypothetical protein